MAALPYTGKDFRLTFLPEERLPVSGGVTLCGIPPRPTAGFDRWNDLGSQVKYEPISCCLCMLVAKKLNEAMKPTVSESAAVSPLRKNNRLKAANFLVRMGRRELPCPYERWNLNPVRLPIPPHPRCERRG